MSKLPIIEIFGPTIQGEGSVIGVKTMFLRTYGCDYKCSWCDSAFTWNGTAKEDVQLLGPSEIITLLEKMALNNFSYVTITGGNPALYSQPMDDLIRSLHDRNYKVILETQGSIWQDWLGAIDHLTVSPKPPSSGMQTDWNVLDRIIQDAPMCSLKIVIFDDKDYQYAKHVHNRYPHIRLYLQSGNPYVHDSGHIADLLLTRLESLFHRVLSDPDMNDVITLPQLHTLVWNNERGK